MPSEPFFELSWAVLSTIGQFNVLLSILVIGITRLSWLSSVPLAVSAACALANGLCYYTYYGNHAWSDGRTAIIIADIAWLVQEAGTSLYGYLILCSILQQTAYRIFVSGFWLIMAAVTSLRIGVIYFHSHDYQGKNQEIADRIHVLHTAYFIQIAFLEMWNSIFLLRALTKARRRAQMIAPGFKLWKYLSHSTEIRLITLSFIGIMRACSFPLQQNARAASIRSQLDRFAYTLECLFPEVLIVDLLAAKLRHSYIQIRQARPERSTDAEQFSVDGQPARRYWWGKTGTTQVENIANPLGEYSR